MDGSNDDFDLLFFGNDKQVMRENEREVLEQLEYGLGEYTYISSMAVAEKNRRRGLASVVLSAAEQQSRIWDQPHVALHVSWAWQGRACACLNSSGCN